MLPGITIETSGGGVTKGDRFLQTSFEFFSEESNRGYIVYNVKYVIPNLMSNERQNYD